MTAAMPPMIRQGPVGLYHILHILCVLTVVPSLPGTDSVVGRKATVFARSTVESLLLFAYLPFR
jgi:hypothetical protein